MSISNYICLLSHCRAEVEDCDSEEWIHVTVFHTAVYITLGVVTYHTPLAQGEKREQ